MTKSQLEKVIADKIARILDLKDENTALRRKLKLCVEALERAKVNIQHDVTCLWMMDPDEWTCSCMAADTMTIVDTALEEAGK